MDPVNLISGTDNLWKYLFTAGIVLVSLSIIYPLQKRQAIELKVSEFEKETNVIATKISFLESDLDKLQSYDDSTVIVLDSMYELVSAGQVTAGQLQFYNDLSEKYQTRRKEFEKRLRDVTTLNVENQSSEDHIKLLSKQAGEYASYFSLFFYLGLFLAAFGLIAWFRSAVMDEIIKDMKLRQETNIEFDGFMNHFTTKCVSLFKQLLKIKILLFAFSILLILLVVRGCSGLK